MKRGMSVYQTKEDPSVALRLSQAHFDNMDAVCSWWSVMPHWESESRERAGYTVNYRVGQSSGSVCAYSVAGAIEQALELAVKLQD